MKIKTGRPRSEKKRKEGSREINKQSFSSFYSYKKKWPDNLAGR